MDSGLQLLDSGFQLLDSGFQLLDSGFQLPDSGFQLLDSGFQLLDSGFQLLDSGFQLLDSKSFSVELGFRIPIVSWIPRFLQLHSGFQGPGFRIPQAKISKIPDSPYKNFPDSGIPYIGRNFN